MKYLSGFYALTIACELNTDGSTHFGSLDWSNESLDLKDSENSIFGDWGIEKDKVIFEHPDEKYNVANHIRAILDMMEEGRVYVLRNFREHYIGTDEYNDIIFEKVYMLRDKDNWDLIDDLMWSCYGDEWKAFIENTTGKPYTN